MFIKKLTINNFRLFATGEHFEIENINVPDGKTEGSGLTVFVGENGCGKTSLLDAFTLPLLSYKAEGFSIDNFCNPKEKIEIKILSNGDFTFAGTMPKGNYQAKGFSFEAKLREKSNKAYLSSVVVSDQKFLRADGEAKPIDGSPDLRIAVNNPFKGPRFNENDILFLDKNRLFQTRTGTYNTTRFDRLMEDFDSQYLAEKIGDVDNLNNHLNTVIGTNINNEFLRIAVNKFNEISKSNLTLEFINNWRPFDKSFFAEKKTNNQQIPINMLGSGYEMIFSLLYSFYLAQQSKKQLIILIDEPELHLHPALQEALVKLLLEFSKTSQIILTSHSPLLIKQLSYNSNVKMDILQKMDSHVKVVPFDERVLPYVSANEINYLAFRLPTEEYHNELYEELKFCKGDSKDIKTFDNDFFINEKKEIKGSPWKGNPNEVSIHTFIRNQIHHQRDNGKPNLNDLNNSIIQMRNFLQEILVK